MHVLKSNLLARASLGALAVAASFAAAPAQAQTQTLSGGGATLPALVVDDLFSCYTSFGVSTVPGSVCNKKARVNTTTAFTYSSVGSGAGQRGWASQERTRFQSPPQNTATGAVTFGASEAALTSSLVGFYNNGGRFSSTGPLDLADQADNCVAQATTNPAPGTGQDFIPLTAPTATAGCFNNPRVEAGPAIQIPFVGVGVTVAFDPVYKSVRNANGSITNYAFQFTSRPDQSGGLNLSRAAFCGIFSGTITRWNDAQITADNGGTPVWPDPTDAGAVAGTDTRGRSIVVTVRDDDSGTTAVFTRALRAQCSSTYTSGVLSAGFAQAFPGNPTPNSIPAPTLPATLNPTCDVNEGNARFSGQWVYARGNEGVAFCLNTAAPKKKAGATVTNGRIGYLSPSFALPVVFTAPYAGYALQTVDLANSSGNFIAPDAAGVVSGLGAFPIPAVANRADPLAWVANPSGDPALNNPIADPSPADAYSIVGTSNLLLYTCYRTPTIANAIASTGAVPGFVNWLFDSSQPSTTTTSVAAVIRRQGFQPIPTAFGDAIVRTFANAADPDGLNLYIRPVSGPATPGTDCTVGAG